MIGSLLALAAVAHPVPFEQHQSAGSDIVDVGENPDRGCRIAPALLVGALCAVFCDGQGLCEHGGGQEASEHGALLPLRTPFVWLRVSPLQSSRPSHDIQPACIDNVNISFRANPAPVVRAL